MGDADRLDLERPDGDPGSRRGLPQVDVVEDLVLGGALAHEAEGVSPAVHRYVEPPEEVGHGADVILVAVREKEPGDAQPVERGEVGVDDVDPEPAPVERDAAVDDERLAPLLEREAVHPDLAEPSQGDDAERRHERHA